MPPKAKKAKTEAKNKNSSGKHTRFVAKEEVKEVLKSDSDSDHDLDTATTKKPRNPGRPRGQEVVRPHLSHSLFPTLPSS